MPAPDTGKIRAAVPVGAAHHSVADKDAAGIGHRLQPRGDVHAIAEHVAIVFDDIAEIDADAQTERAVREAGLNLYCRVQRLVDARKRRQEPVAGALVGASSMALQHGHDEIVESRAQRHIGRRFILGHQSAVADDVAGNDRGKLAFHLDLELPRIFA